MFFNYCVSLAVRACRCTFIRVSGAELVQKYIGEGSRMVRELFVMARESAPTIIFMDEVRENQLHTLYRECS